MLPPAPALDDLLSGLVRALDRVRPWRVFDRPVFVLAAPRSGSTLLREMLERHPDLVGWRGEAHPAFAAARPHVVEEGHRWEPSVATDALRRRLSQELYLGMLRERGQEPRARERLLPRRVRLLEKTPANVLRIGALARLYPDARLVFLHRDAPASMNSLLEAWETPTTAHVVMDVHGRRVPWMMLAAPGWLDLADADAATKSAFQWRVAQEHALSDLADLPAERVVRVSYEDLTRDPVVVLRRVLEHCELTAHPDVLATASAVGSAGRTSLSAPRPDKWRERAAQIEPHLPALASLRERLGYPV